MDFDDNMDIFDLDAEPVYLTAKSYSTENLTKNAAFDLKYAHNKQLYSLIFLNIVSFF